MPAATQVHHSKFPVDHVIYDNGAFAIAWGAYDGNPRSLGMRWNGGPNDVGYPKLFQNPVWFVLPPELSVPFVKSLLGAQSAKNQALLQVLEDLRASGALDPAPNP